ncbi:MAG TPA: tetratricopeptide repeat protein, partial [Kofleriaceae bacterium]
LTADRAEATALATDAKAITLDAAQAAQRAFKGAPESAGANVAMGEVLRLQGKPARDARRYLDAARGKGDKDWARELALAEALQQVHDGKLDDAKAAFTAIDQGDGKLEASCDVRARFHLALVLAAQNKPADARPLADSIIAAQPEHAGAKALLAKLETNVATSDPLPPEEPSANPGKPTNPANPTASPGKPSGPTTSPSGSGPTTVPSGGGGGGSYDALIASANKAAESSCARAIELYNKALEQKPNGVEALTGLGYCYVDAKQFSSAFGKFRSALAISSRYEPALRGIAEGYLQQGRKDLAIEAYKHYLEVYPDNAAAKKQLDRLGGGPDQPPPAAPSSAGPTTTPDKSPSPDSTGPGSASE